MSQTLPHSEDLRQLADEVSAIASKPSPTQRDCWQALEKVQQYIDTLEEMAEDLPAYDQRVTIAREGKRIRFESVDAIVNYLLKFGALENGQ